MAGRRAGPVAAALFRFDRPFLRRHGVVAGVDEAGCGPLAGPVVAAAVILPPRAFVPRLNDSKQLTHEKRCEVYRVIQRVACAIGVGIVDHAEIDRLNIRQAGFAAMRLALRGLVISPDYVLVDGFRIPGWHTPHRAIIDGDAKSARIAAASIIAKVTRDCLMEALDRRYPGYGFKQHKGYGTELHIECLDRLGPSPVHRLSFAPVRLARGRERVG
ncbi:MAG TPA: ribonuclease HII [Elusimicrobiota bacterium]|nr:ribonuclease HII [Elusimicrobiota bacterium]